MFLDILHVATSRNSRWLKASRCFRMGAVAAIAAAASMASVALAASFPAASLPAASFPAAPQQAAATRSGASPDGTPLSPETVAKLLPSSVYFQGKTAPLQLRNAAAVRFGADATAWVALVDTSGYATDVKEKYQFYLVTEAPLTIGEAKIAAGAYGGGFLGERFLLMDLGGHTVAEGRVENDPALKRPRPLQLLPETSDAVKLYLGRHWVEMKSFPGQGR